MAHSYATYSKEINRGLFYGATWTPGTQLKLGTIGTFRKGIFVPQSRLSSFDIVFEEEWDNSKTSYTYASSSGVSLEFKGKGQVGKDFKSLTDAVAGVAVRFTRSNAVMFSIGNCLEHRIKDILALQQELAHRLTRQNWNEEWAVVTHLVEAASGTILLSSSSDTTVELEASGSGGSGPVSLGDLSAGVKMSYADSMNQLIVAEEGLTPLYHTLRLKRSFWTGKPTPVFNKSTIRDAAVESQTQKTIRAEDFEQIDLDESELADD